MGSYRLDRGCQCWRPCLSAPEFLRRRCSTVAGVDMGCPSACQILSPPPWPYFAKFSWIAVLLLLFLAVGFARCGFRIEV